MKKMLTLSLAAMSAAVCVFAQEAVATGEATDVGASLINKIQDEHPEITTLEGKNGNHFYTVAEAIKVPAGKKGHALSRTIAYRRAFARARAEFQTYLETQVANAMKTMGGEGSEDAKPDPEIAGLVKESMAKKAQAAGIDPNDEAAFAKYMKENIVNSTSFKKEASLASAGFQQGLMVYATSTSPEEVAVIAHFSPRNLKVARAVWSNQVEELKEEKPGTVLKEQMPKTPNEWANTFGVRICRNEKGEYCVVGFGHGVAASHSRTSVSNAGTKARISALEEIKDFAGAEMVFGEAQKASESSAEAGGEEFATNSEALQQSIEQKKSSLKISGVTQIASRVVKLPSNEIVCVTAYAWVPSATLKADAVHSQMEQGRDKKNPGFKPAPAYPTPSAKTPTPRASSSTDTELKAVGTSGSSSAADLD